MNTFEERFTAWTDGHLSGEKLAAFENELAEQHGDAAAERDSALKLGAFLREHGLTPIIVQGLGIEAIRDVDNVTQDDLIEFGARVHASAPDADSMLVSCGGFRTLEIIAPLEARTGVPVISSMPHGLWAGARLVGMSGASPGYGALLSADA